MKILSPLLILITVAVSAQTGLQYKKPSKEILELVDAPLAPSVQMDSKGEFMVLLYRDQYKSIAELSEKEMRLAGLRVNPKTNIGSRVTYFNGMKVRQVKGGKEQEIQGLPKPARLTNFRWSTDQSKMAFTNTTEKGVEVWYVDIKMAKAFQVTQANVNANLGNPLYWYPGDKALLVKMLPAERKQLINTSIAVPTGPTVSESKGEKAQNRTYQDLLKNKDDENNFEQLVTAELHLYQLDGTSRKWMDQAMYYGISFSPNGKYVFVSTMKRPFSYIVPYNRFPRTEVIYDANGKKIKVFNEVPLTEELPKGFMAVRTGKRNISWRNDKPATLVWVEALDKGDPAMEVEYRDQAYAQDAPFTSEPSKLIKTRYRFGGINWGTDEVALASDFWWNTRMTSTYLFSPKDNAKKPEIVVERNYQDRYSDPGNPVTKKNEWGERVLDIQDGHIYLIGDGFTKEGQFPFIDKHNLGTKKKTRVYQSKYTNKIESILFPTDLKKGDFLVSIQSATEFPNFYMRNVKKSNKLQQITNFENPFKSIMGVHKEVIKYKRDDGLELSGTLYLPVGYDKSKKEKMPFILWAYPREYKDKSSASQVTSNPNRFTYPFYGSMIYWVTKGYVVLDNAAFPIVGEGDEEPNDSFRKQLVGNAKAAIDAVDKLGYIDRNRCAVGGHSYGAFMTANLLTHSNLFAAGIARSGAYNRTLTPFGFQSEERSYWDAPEVYYTMSPFMHADKMKTPLLLIHGQDDNNSGTYPMQSERYFNALKGLGGPARLVLLPKESHGYRAKESILHMLWEQEQWLDTHVKNKRK